MVGKSVVTLDGLSTNQILDLLHKAEYIDSHRKEVAHTCDGRVLATLFYEPSTRTRLSFETAMLRLGGKVIGFAGAQLASVIGDLDVLYMTRVQKERFFNEDDYLRLRDTYILNEEKLQLAKPSMAVLHPLPRVNEIAVDVDDDPRAAYFEQVKNGMLVRMALESTVVGDELPGYEPLNPKEVQA